MAVFLYFASIAAYLTHLFTCIGGDRWGMLLVGLIAPPVGVIHGLMIWF